MRFFVWQSRHNLKEQEIDFVMKMKGWPVMIAPLLFSEIILYDVLTSAAH